MTPRDQIAELGRKLESIRGQKQTLESEAAKTDIEWQLEILRAKRSIRVYEKAAFLLATYMKNGRAFAMLPDGRRAEMSVYEAGNQIQRFFNARGAALDLAERAEA